MDESSSSSSASSPRGHHHEDNNNNNNLDAGSKDVLKEPIIKSTSNSLDIEDNSETSKNFFFE
jgi:hypothetical protein